MDEDLLRKGPTRLMGSPNEVGEAFRPLVHYRAGHATYAAAAAYVASDAAWRVRAQHGPVQAKAIEAADSLLWQGLASIAIPGITINRIVWAAQKVAPAAGKGSATAVGLAAIPVIVGPIDEGVERFLNATVRPLYKPKSKE